jgi:phosphotransferase system HPr-like phosphotransfer protein
MENPNDVCRITFADKINVFSRDVLKCCLYVDGLTSLQHGFTKKLYSKMVSTAMNLEDFLDVHGAKNNKEWYYYRELAAAIRHLSQGANFQKHISNRLVFYDLADTDTFIRQGRATHDFLNGTLKKIAPAFLAEAGRLGIELPECGFAPGDFPSNITGEMLEYNIDDIDKDLQKKNIVKIASEFLAVAAEIDHFRFYEPYDAATMYKLVPEKVNEVVVRRLEMLVHSLQSAFDTYVIHGGFRFGNRKLKQLRSHFSVVLHLLQMIGRLLHFYERHLYEAGYKNIYKKVQDRLAELINPEMLLDRIINYSLFYICHFLSDGKSLAQEILNENVERGAITVGVPVKLGFHSRPSLLVAKVVQHYGGKVELCIGSDRFDASSVLDIQWAGGKIAKENISEVRFEGDARALRDIEVLAGVNYGEDSMGKGIALPRELNYLR